MRRKTKVRAADVPKEMKAIGGRWDREKNAWRVPKARRAELDALLARIKGRRGR